ncbi:uncharacterized protein METZ01_LOCUS374297, partial [marine metagenome]
SFRQTIYTILGGETQFLIIDRSGSRSEQTWMMTETSPRQLSHRIGAT